jgi:hypothetical protein
MPAKPLAVGDVIHGFAHGVFGHDHYDCVRIEAVGPDWIVARQHSDTYSRGLAFAAGRSELQLCIQARDEPCPEDPCPFGKYEQPLTDIASNR